MANLTFTEAPSGEFSPAAAMITQSELPAMATQTKPANAGNRGRLEPMAIPCNGTRFSLCVFRRISMMEVSIWLTSTHVFISYAHQDTIIAHAIRDQLTLLAQAGEGARSLKCFLDTESIEPGQKFEPVIKAALQDADWLLVVFTGDQSVYCGYEIGMYSILKPHEDRATVDKPVAWLHDVDKIKLPAVVNGYNTTLISPIAPYLPDPPNDLTPDARNWWNSSAGKLLRAICASKGLYTPEHRTTDPVQYQVDLAQAASRIASPSRMPARTMKNRIRRFRPPWS